MTAAVMAFTEGAAQAAFTESAAPLPNGDQLLLRAIASESKLASEQERYDCRVSDEITELDGKGKVKRTYAELKEQFFVNGDGVQRTLARTART